MTMCVRVPKVVQHGSFELSDFKLMFCMYNKLHLHAAILS